MNGFTRPEERKKMKINIFVCVIIFLDVCASIMYLIQKDFVRSIYWFSAGILSATTMFM
jgi:uncharacterized MnhB-related membrane protein